MLDCRLLCLHNFHLTSTITLGTIFQLFSCFVLVFASKSVQKQDSHNYAGFENATSSNVIIDPPLADPRKHYFTHSGQQIRLRGLSRRQLGIGRIEVYFAGKWGLICDKDFDISDANVVCRQLGFERGAIEVRPSRSFDSGELRLFNMANVSCEGTESSVFYCRRPMKADCPTRQPAAVYCRPNYASMCESDGVLFRSKCFHFSKNKRTFLEAVASCESRNGSLAIIQSQEENDFVSEAILAIHPNVDTWFIGGRRESRNQKDGWKWQTTQDLEPSTFTKWRPNMVDSNAKDCMILFRGKTASEKQYYFWETSKCEAKRSFVCQLHPKDIGCTSGDGTDYRGFANTTRLGLPCLAWNNPRVLRLGINVFENQAQLDHNYCRNYDSDESPWCLVSLKQFDSCDIPECKGTESTNQFCEKDEIRCGNLTKCVATDFLCDYDHDCPNGFDEEGCKDWLQKFTRSQGKRIVAMVQEVWTNIPHAQGCAKRCLENSNVPCLSFSYKSEEQSCYLSIQNSEQGILLTTSRNADYYELVEHTTLPSSTAVENCEDKFRCDTGKCIDQSYLCNNKSDCGDSDNSDERLCSEFTVRLAGSENAFEGRVEVRAYGVWGVVCDDHWDINDANVVCKQLGFIGATYAMVGSVFGSGNGKFMMDDVNCIGYESSLDKCHFPGWKISDCGTQEAAGVVCSQAVSGCLRNQFQCKNQKCIDITWICDSDDDCKDGSDEVAGMCAEPVKVRLVGGSQPNSGRVEVQYYGVWGTICDDHWDERDAEVICRMLGVPGRSLAFTGGHYMPGSDQIWLDDVNCQGNETTLSDCQKKRWGHHDCKHEEDAGVRCFGLNQTYSSAPGDCGRRFINSMPRDPRKPRIARIVGGFEAEHGAYPWTASIRLKPQKHHCGATIIDDFHVLTAAHCFEDEPKLDSYEVVVGDWDNQRPDGTEQVFQIAAMKPFPAYQNVLEHDIAVVKLKPNNNRQFIEFNDYVQPACLPEPGVQYDDGLKCIVTGWGSLGTAYPRKQQAAELPVLAREKCTSPSVYGRLMSRTSFCAGFLRGGVDSCQGDSGGPFVCSISGKFTILGVISWGDGCAAKNKPGIYTKVTEYLDWIKRTIKI